MLRVLCVSISLTLFEWMGISSRASRICSMNTSTFPSALMYGLPSYADDFGMDDGCQKAWSQSCGRAHSKIRTRTFLRNNEEPEKAGNISAVGSLHTSRYQSLPSIKYTVFRHSFNVGKG